MSVGQAATFSVNAETYGVANTAYQWFWNGWKVPGATRPSFTVRPAEVADDGSMYSVEVTNFYGSASAAATLTVTPVPRAPKLGDLRFQGVDAAPTRMPLGTTNFPSQLWMTYGDAGGTPLLTGTGLCGDEREPSIVCSWGYMAFLLPPTHPRTNVIYAAGRFDAFDREVNALGPNSVITSVYVENVDDPRALWAFSVMQLVEGPGFDLRRDSVVPADLAAAIAREGALSRVVTAIYFHTGNAAFFSYGWSGDRATVYETEVVNTTLASAGSAAASLASAGYIITALGRSSTNTLVLVGTRAQGDTMARPLRWLDGYLAGQELVAEGFAIVGYIYEETRHEWTWIGEQ